MVRRLEAAWPPFGYYLIDEYVNDLSLRSGLTVLLDQLSPGLGIRIYPVLNSVDHDLWVATIPDESSEILRHYSPTDDPSLLGWWWRRVPAVRPWQARPDE